MSIEISAYDHEIDFYRVGDFLLKQYRPGNNPLNWIQPRWEYMHFHPLLADTDVSKIGVAEIDGEIAGVVHYEHDEGVIYFQVDPELDDVKAALFDYAEKTFEGADERGRKRLVIFINEADLSLQNMAKQRGYKDDVEWREVTSRYLLSEGIPEVALPEGFRLQSLADENDLDKISRVMWRGFDHEGQPPEDDAESREQMQAAPNFRHDLTIVAVAPNGEYVSFCGIWYVPQNRITYVEPVATDPDYRRMGLGKAVVLEGIRRTIPLGAEVAWVGSEQEFYMAIGFEQSYRAVAWIKYL